MRLATLILAALATAARADAPRLAEVTTDHAHVIVRGELPAPRVRELISLVATIATDVEQRFGITHERSAPIALMLFTDAARYRQEALALRTPLVSERGFYLPDRRIAIANVGNSVGNLRHELVHPLLGDDYPAIPSWLNEGIASLYGSATIGKRGVTFLVNYRLRDLQRALKAGTLPTVAELAATTPDQMYGDRAMVFYALARYVLFYVNERGKLAQLYGELRAAKATEHPAILARYVDDKRFRAWAAKLHR